MKNGIKKSILDILFFTAGSFIYALAVTIFITPNEISPGGVTGIATAISSFVTVPSGILLFLINIPILLIGFWKFGGVFIVKTAIASFMSSFALTLTDLFLPVFRTDKILASLFGGLLMGLGLSFIILRGATTGGVDIIAKLINEKYRHLTVGRIILLLDFTVIVFASVVYRNIESALYSAVTIYATSYIMDLVLYGSDKGKMVYIITDCQKEICFDISNDLKRGVTVLSAVGGYTGKDRTLLLCTLRRHEVSQLYDIIDRHDKNAFIVVAEVGEIIGEGFKLRRGNG